MKPASGAPVPADLLAGEFSSATIPRELQPYVSEINAYAERFTRNLRGQRLRRDECSGARVVVIFEFGPPLRVIAPGAGASRQFARGFVAGPGGSFAGTEFSGRQSGIQMNLTLPGAALIFGVPLSEYFAQPLPVAFEELLPVARDLPERLFHAAAAGSRTSPAGQTSARFALLIEWLCERLAAGQALLTRPGFHAVQAVLASSPERTPGVGELADQLGYSRKHLTALFRRFAGAAPGTILRLRRFEALLDVLRTGSASSLEQPGAAQIALDCGYYDQSHCIREVRAWSGMTPGALPELLAPRLVG